MKKAIFWYLLTLIVTAFTVAVIYTPQVYHGGDSVRAARAAFPPILIIQGVILIFLGTGSVASGITREKVDNVLNYQRLTPMPIRDKILGYLFGLPVRQYVLFGITLPFLAFVLLVGRIPPRAFMPFYLVFTSSTILYHFTGLVAGMISKRWRWSARISQGLIILLYFVLPQLSHLGLVFLEFLTVRPVFVEHILPMIGSNSGTPTDGIGFVAGKSVPFFNLQISGTLFSFIIQSGLITLFVGIVARKWKSDAVPAISKPMALIAFCAFSVMCLGNVWPNLVRSDNALKIFQSDGDLASVVAVVALPLILSLATTLLAFVLMISALPDPMQYRHGQIRARRHLRPRLTPWEDAAGGYLFTLLIFAVQSLLLSVVYVTLFRSGFFDGIEGNPFLVSWVFFAIALTLFYYQGVKENFGAGPLALFILLGWALPILGAILILAIDQSRISTVLIVAALSPLTTIPYSAAQLLSAESLGAKTIHFQWAFGVGIVMMTVLNAGLHVRLHRMRRRPIDEPGAIAE